VKDFLALAGISIGLICLMMLIRAAFDKLEARAARKKRGGKKDSI
jgi:hypothetical protein